MHQSTKAILTGLLLATSLNAQADSLSSCYALAINNDHQFQQTVNTNNADKENVAITRGHLLPQLTASASLLSNQTNAYTGSETDTQWQVTLTQPLLNVKTWQQLKADKQQSQAATVSTAAARQSLMIRVSQAYMKVANAKQSLQVEQQKQRAQQQLVSIAKHYFKAGKSLSTDISAAQSALQQTNVSLINATNILQANQSSLAVITGKLSTRIRVIKHNPRLNNPNPNRMSAWTQQAASANLNAISDHYNMLSARDRIKVADAGHYPTLEANAGYQNYHGDNDIAGTVNNRGTTAGLSLELPIFSGGSVMAESRQAEDRYLASSQAWQLDVASAQDQARTAFQAIINDVNQLNALNSTLRIQQTALTDMIHAYEGGVRSMNDVLDQQTLLYASKQQLIDARYDYLLQQLKLKQAVGTLDVHDLDSTSKLFNTTEVSV